MCKYNWIRLPEKPLKTVETSCATMAACLSNPPNSPVPPW